MRPSWQASTCALLFAAVVTACASSGNKFDASKVDQLRPGISTAEEAVTLLGKPTAESNLVDGSKLLQWQYMSVLVASASSDHVAILFDTNGKMIRITHRSQIR